MGEGEVRYVLMPGMPSGHVLNATALMAWAVLEVSAADADPNVAVEWCALILSLTVPVPWARWYNFDHSFKQVWVSFVAGLIVGTIGFYIRKCLFPQHSEGWTRIPFEE